MRVTLNKELADGTHWKQNLSKTTSAPPPGPIRLVQILQSVNLLCPDNSTGAANGGYCGKELK